MPTDVVIAVWTMSSRSGIGRRDTDCRATSVLTAGGVHDVLDIDPNEATNMSVLFAFE